MKEKFFGMAVAALMAAAMTGCQNQAKPQWEYLGDSLAINSDEGATLYGACGLAANDSTLLLISDSGDTLKLNMSQAIANNRIIGDLNPGDRLVVVPNKKGDEVKIVINQTMMLGNWVMPNPLDGSDEQGIRIKEGGIAEGIEQSSVSYRTWKIVDGRLEIVSIREGGGQEEEANLYDIVRLTPDSLIFKNDEDIFEYGRQQVKKPLSDIKLEESSADDYNI